MKAGWAIKTLDDVCKVASSNISQNKLNDEVGNYPIYGASGLIKNVSFYHRDKPYLSIVKDGSGVGRVTKMQAFSSVIGTLQYILPKEGVDLDYLNYSLMSVDFKKYVAGAAIPHIYFKDYKNEPFLWMPIQEQQFIVAILDQAFEGIAEARTNAEKNLQNARALFESHLQSVFSQHKSDWVTKTVGELVTDGVLYKPFDGNHGEIHPRKIDFTETGVPFVMASDLVNGLVDTENCNHISKKLADSLRVGFARNDDVLISHKGTIGRSAIVSTSHEYIMLTPQVTAYRIKSKESLLNKFIRYYFMSPIFQSEIITAAQDGSTRAYVGITRQENLKFRYPSLSEQHSIVETLDQLLPETQRLETLYQRKIACLDELKKSLLQQAFAGEL